MRILSVDPGKHGAFVILDFVTNTIEAHKVPLTTRKGEKSVIDVKGLFECVRECVKGVNTIIIEDVHSMPRDGVVSAFSFGYFKGLLMGMLFALGVDDKCVFIPPQVWKGAMGLLKDKTLPANRQGPEAKKRACALARAMVGSGASTLKTEGMCEAALIGMYWALGPGHGRTGVKSFATLRPVPPKKT